MVMRKKEESFSIQLHEASYKSENRCSTLQILGNSERSTTVPSQRY